MSRKIIQVFWSWYNSGIDRTEVRCMIECDSLTDLPGVNAITGYRLTIGTTAHVIDTNSVYMMQSGGAWKVQSAGTDVYTKAQIDTMMAAKQDTLTFDDTPTTGSNNPVKSKGIKSYVDTAVSDKITMLNILGAGMRITATSANPLSFNDAPFTSVGRFNWLSASTPHITNCPTYIGGVAKGGLLETSLIQGGTTILQTAWASAGDDTPGIFWRRYCYGSPATWTNWYKFEGVQV